MASAKNVRNEAIKSAEYIQQGEGRVLGELDQGLNTAREDTDKAQAYYNPYAERYGAGSEMWSNALGLRGQAGTDAAKNAFEAGPGYQWQFDQGMQALNRRRAAGGMLNSGNADIDAMKYGQGLGQQSWNNWVNNLGTLDQRGIGTAQQQAGLQSNMGNLAYQNATRRSGVVQDNINNIVGLRMGAAKASDAARAQNDANLMAGAKMGLDLLGSALGGGGGGSGGTGGTPGNMGFLRFFAGT